jgi:outer membrane protein insertion porin family
LGIFRRIFASQVFALSLHARELRGDQLEVSDLYRLGGTNSLRGYRENQFLANRLLWSNLELRQPFTRRSFGFIFFDSGYYLRDQDPEKNIERSSAIKLGYGLGLNIETGFGILSVSYALAKGDSFSQGKIHFGLVNEF